MLSRKPNRKRICFGGISLVNHIITFFEQLSSKTQSTTLTTRPIVIWSPDDGSVWSSSRVRAFNAERCKSLHCAPLSDTHKDRFSRVCYKILVAIFTFVFTCSVWICIFPNGRKFSSFSTYWPIFKRFRFFFKNRHIGLFSRWDILVVLVYCIHIYYMIVREQVIYFLCIVTIRFGFCCCWCETRFPI